MKNFVEISFYSNGMSDNITVLFNRRSEASRTQAEGPTTPTLHPRLTHPLLGKSSHSFLIFRLLFSRYIYSKKL